MRCELGVSFFGSGSKLVTTSAIAMVSFEGWGLSEVIKKVKKR